MCACSLVPHSYLKSYDTFDYFMIRDTVADPVARVGTEKHEIYVAAFGGHLFYDLFSQNRGEGGPCPPGSAMG